MTAAGRAGVVTDGRDDGIDDDDDEEELLRGGTIRPLTDFKAAAGAGTGDASKDAKRSSAPEGTPKYSQSTVHIQK
jgi:hypothetical protein